MEESIGKSGSGANDSDQEPNSPDRLSEAESEIFGQPMLVEYTEKEPESLKDKSPSKNKSPEKKSENSSLKKKEEDEDDSILLEEEMEVARDVFY